MPADNAKCRAALVELMGIMKTYRDGMGLDGSSDVLSMIRENKDFEGDDHVMSLYCDPAVNDNARVLSGSLSRTRTIFKGNASPRVALNDNSIYKAAMEGQKVDSIFDWDYDIHMLNKVSNQN